MKIIFLIILSIVGGSSVDSLIDALDAIGPGTSDMFVKWGQEEQMLENHYKILVGEIPKPDNFPKIPALEFALTVSYMHPRISRDELGYMLQQAFQSNKLLDEMMVDSKVAANRLLEIANSLTTLRDSLFAHLFTEIGMSMKANKGRPDLEAIANSQFPLIREVYADSHDLRFMSIKRTFSTIKIWYHMCIEEMIASPVPSPNQPCVFDWKIQEWRMTPDTIVSLRRYFVLAAIKSRQA